MKKAMVCMALTLCLAAVSREQVFNMADGVAGAVRDAFQPQDDAGGADATITFEEQLGVMQNRSVLDITLYYRFAGTDMLGMQPAQLDMRREETVASSIVQALIDGPDAGHDRLAGVFPQGTSLISVAGSGATAFVTLSRAFLGKPDGAPSDWEDIPAWQEEAALRRRLAVQSITLALTDGGRYQRVQLYVADSDDDVPERIPLMWFGAETVQSSTMLAACARDESVLMTPQSAMEVILSAWQARDWAKIYPLLARGQGEDLPTLSAFEAQMRQTGVSLMAGTVADGAVSVDGQTATLVLDASIRSEDGGDAQIERESVPLVRDADNWAIRLSTLMSLMIRE